MKNNISKYNQLAIFLFAFTLPLGRVSNVFLIVFIILFSLETVLVKNSIDFSVVKKSTVILFFSSLLGLIYTINFNWGLNLIGREIIFIIIPLLFSLNSKSNFKELLRFALDGLLYGMLISSIYLLFFYFKSVYFEDNISIRLLLSHKLIGLNFITYLKDMHQSYYGFYLILVFNYIVLRRDKTNKLFLTFSLIIMSLVIVLLNSRVFLILYIISFLFFIFTIPNRKLKIKILGSSILISTIFFYIINDTYLMNKITSGIKWELSDNIGTSNTSGKIMSDSRLSRWKVAFQLFKEKPLLGYGKGSEESVLNKAYMYNNMQVSVKQKYNTHNQFLYYLLELGLIGFVIYLYFIIANLWMYIRSKNSLAVLFFISIFLFSFVENFFNRNMGFTFVVLFSNLFLFEARVKENVI